MKILRSPFFWIAFALLMVVGHRVWKTVAPEPTAPEPQAAAPVEREEDEDESGSPSSSTSEDRDSQTSNPNASPRPIDQLCSAGSCSANEVLRVGIHERILQALAAGESVVTLQASLNSGCWRVGDAYVLDTPSGSDGLSVVKSVARLMSQRHVDGQLQLTFAILIASPSERDFAGPVCGSLCQQVVREIPPSGATPNIVIGFENAPSVQIRQSSPTEILIRAPVAQWASRIPWSSLPKDKSSPIYLYTQTPFLISGGLFDAMKEASRQGYSQVHWMYPAFEPQSEFTLWPPTPLGTVDVSHAHLTALAEMSATAIAVDESSKPKNWKGRVISVPSSVKFPSFSTDWDSQEALFVQEQAKPLAEFIKQFKANDDIVIMGNGLLDHRVRMLASYLVRQRFLNVHIYRSGSADWVDARLQ